MSGNVEEILWKILDVLIEIRDADSTADSEAMIRRLTTEMSPQRVKEMVEATLIAHAAHPQPKDTQ